MLLLDRHWDPNDRRLSRLGSSIINHINSILRHFFYLEVILIVKDSKMEKAKFSAEFVSPFKICILALIEILHEINGESDTAFLVLEFLVHITQVGELFVYFQTIKSRKIGSL